MPTLWSTCFTNTFPDRACSDHWVHSTVWEGIYRFELKWSQYITDTGASNRRDMMKNTLQEEVASDANQLARHRTFSAICHMTESHASPGDSFCIWTVKELELVNF